MAWEPLYSTQPHIIHTATQAWRSGGIKALNRWVRVTENQKLVERFRDIIPKLVMVMQTAKQTDARYRIHYLLLLGQSGSAVRAETDGQTDGQTDGCYQFYYLPALLKLSGG